MSVSTRKAPARAPFLHPHTPDGDRKFVRAAFGKGPIGLALDGLAPAFTPPAEAESTTAMLSTSGMAKERPSAAQASPEEAQPAERRARLAGPHLRATLSDIGIVR
jgi:hypothetical protein